MNLEQRIKRLEEKVSKRKSLKEWEEPTWNRVTYSLLKSKLLSQSFKEYLTVSSILESKLKHYSSVSSLPEGTNELDIVDLNENLYEFINQIEIFLKKIK